MYNLRYHIASLVAVFFALALGLLLGTVVAERGVLDDQAVSVVKDLQQRFDEISAENDELTLGLERDRAFAQEAVDPLISEELVGKNVAILASAGSDGSVAPIEETVQAAGGTTFLVTLNTPALGLDETEPEGLAGYLHGRDIEIERPGQALLEQVAEVLAEEWRAGAQRPFTEYLVSTGLIATASMTGTATVDAVVIAGTGTADCDAFALALAARLVEQGVSAVGVEMSDTPDGVAPSCDAAGLSAIDHLGTPQGRLSLVYVLAGRASGYFGSGDGADAYYPAIEP